MTAQIGDTYKYRNKKYTIVAMSAAMRFHPRDYGLEAHSSSTACWRGFWCEYVIEDDRLLLRDLNIYNHNDNYPRFYGVEVSPQEFWEDERIDKYGKVEKVRSPKRSERVYRDVNMPVPYTGKLLLGDGFLREYYIHMGYQHSWAYEKLIELVFEEGRLLECSDLSYIAEAQREALKGRIENIRYPDYGNIMMFIKESFSLDYADKAWWLE